MKFLIVLINSRLSKLFLAQYLLADNVGHNPSIVLDEGFDFVLKAERIFGRKLKCKLQTIKYHSER